MSRADEVDRAYCRRVTTAYLEGLDQKGPCHTCGHRHPTMASASQGGKQRWYCHADNHSCYNDRRGRYFQGEEQ